MTNHLQLAFRHLRQYTPADPPRSARADTETSQEQQRGAAAAAGVPLRRPRSFSGRTAGPPRAPRRRRRRRREPAPGRGGRGRGARARLGKGWRHGALPGLGRWRGEFALPPGRVREGSGPVASPAARSAPRPPPRGLRARPPLLGAASLPARTGPPRAPGPPRRGAPLLRGARLPSPAPVPWAATQPSGGREGPAEESGRARMQAPPPEPLRYRSGDGDYRRGVAANLSRRHWACARGDHIRENQVPPFRGENEVSGGRRT
ncbi:serine/arginine repetitive matrix protein 3-like [Saccopteryx leptura]|uniref:serine/arginine repetitive matrix protein 3-like n=1 Tax=Saccopteryx leptura TaxID=249018 RepID=UPI00339CC787